MWIQLLLTLLMALLNWLLNRESVPASKTAKLGKVRDLCNVIGRRLATMGVPVVEVTEAELAKAGMKDF